VDPSSSPRHRLLSLAGNGRDRSAEFVAIIAAIMALRVTRIVLDGEAVTHCPEGLSDFNAPLGQVGDNVARATMAGTRALPKGQAAWNRSASPASGGMEPKRLARIGGHGQAAVA
jgi:hypothetical protein